MPYKYNVVHDIPPQKLERLIITFVMTAHIAQGEVFERRLHPSSFVYSLVKGLPKENPDTYSPKLGMEILQFCLETGALELVVAKSRPEHPNEPELFLRPGEMGKMIADAIYEVNPELSEVKKEIVQTYNDLYPEDSPAGLNVERAMVEAFRRMRGEA